MTGTNQGPRTRGRCSLRTAAERDAFGVATQYTRAHDLAVPAESAYLEALPAARREISHRFARGLLRGKPRGLSAPRFVSRESLESESASVPDGSAPLSALEADRLASIAADCPESCRRLGLVALPGAECVLFVPIATRHGYDRFRLVGTIRSWTPNTDAVTELDHPVDLVSLVAREGAFSDDEQADRIRTEIAESVANLALARLASAVHGTRVDGVGDDPPLEAVASGVPAADASAAFERIVTDGHPFHPSGKIRRGMSPGEGLAYAPEFTDRIDVRFVAVDRAFALETRAATAGGERLTDRLYAAFEGLEGALERALPAGCEPDEYAVVPIHPLQYHRTIPDRYGDRIADGRVVPIPDYSRPATPQLNLRTVVPDGDGTHSPDDVPFHLKLAIPVQTTNVVRTLSPHAVSNGPQVTDVVRSIVDRDGFETLGLLAEPAATCYYPPGGPHPSGDGFDDARHLSGLVRTNPLLHPHVAERTAETYPVVASSLVADTPTTGRPLVAELIAQYGDAIGCPSTERAALEFVTRYAAVVVPDQLRLLCTYGIALESHLQNSLVVFDAESARPLSTLVRDLGGIRVYGGRLENHGLSIDPYPDSDLDADDESALYRKLYYALFQNHLAELVATIAYELDVDERACWARIREQCEQAFEAIRADGDAPADRVRRDRRTLFDEPTVHKALTAMRLQGNRHEYVTSDVSNPLSTAGRERIDRPSK
ncbi:IucA/IucC family protein [Natronolimnohabitans sp. A-GB9]|uniref:IucA/IucC family protein n=1 Tax=Natronolimnohabitans sp. A-GB9 TaxID=3069757 RepID=UPI0027AE28B1|nr:IucA/IucC family protein [Natronolimnohabitans sp. A-GB9]MDQ2049849.1 IucA/IucC family protein [Natronolimnohabitans sp. A-GB9]